MNDHEEDLEGNDGPSTVITITLDPLDAKAIARCVARRGGSVMPDGHSDHIGAMLAEICRGWEEMIDMSIKRSKIT